MMECRIETLAEKKLIGFSLEMSIADNKTPILWRSFMQRRSEILNRKNTDFISMQVYDPSFDFARFDIHRPFQKWATAEVSDFDHIPEQMSKFVLSPGMYAVFSYKGDASDAAKAFQYIFGEWLPSSGFSLDNRPHFEVLGDKYKRDDPDSEEEIWIPIRSGK
jgi:AraC family transcriptional regulator